MSSSDNKNDKSDDDDDEEEEVSITDRIKEKLANSFENNEVPDENDSGYESDEEDDDDDSDEEESTQILQKIKDTLAEPIETVKNVADDIENKDFFIEFPIYSTLKIYLVNFFSNVQITSSPDSEKEEEEDGDDDDESQTITEKIKKHLAQPIESAKTLSEQVVDNLKTKVYF